jgi:glycosyltransferase involved in cell wall biosynthesis
MQRRKSVVFISHDASVSGAPILLLNLLALIKKNNVCRFIIVVKRGGVLNHRFEGMEKTVVLKPVNYLKGNILKKTLDVFNSKVKLLQTFYYCYRADIVFSNTITNGRLLNFLRYTRTPVISYIHELKLTAGFFDLFKNSSLTAARTNLFLYPSAAVSDFLYENYSIAEQKKQYLPYYFPEQVVYSSGQKAMARLQFSERYHLDTADLWVVNMGTVCLRKGIDYFLQVVEKTKAAKRKVSFIWIGEYENEEVKLYVADMMEKAKEVNVLFTGAMPNQAANLLPFDVFFLSSREDPYPLVVLEAAYCKIPSVCFAGSGGIPEFIENDAGWIIPDFSVTAAADCIKGIEGDRPVIAIKGNRAMAKAMERHSNAGMVIDKFNQALNTCTT